MGEWKVREEGEGGKERGREREKEEKGGGRGRGESKRTPFQTRWTGSLLEKELQLLETRSRVIIHIHEGLVVQSDWIEFLRRRCMAAVHYIGP